MKRRASSGVQSTSTVIFTAFAPDLEA